MSTALDRVLELLEVVRERNGGFMACCPAHADQRPSLSVSEGDGGKVLVKCFAGCSLDEILDALGLKRADLFERDEPHRNGSRKPSAVWRIKDRAGEVQAEHVRFDRDGYKDCFWRLPGAREWGMEGRKVSTLPLYRAEHVGDWQEDVPVAVVEGEKPADALASVYPAVLGTVTGAESTPGPEALEMLRGRRVVLWPDADRPGRAHMERVAGALQGTASEVRVFEWKGAPPKGDAADHPAVKSRSRKAVEELRSKMAAAPVFEVSPASPSLNSEGHQGHPLRSVRFNEIPEPGPRRYHLDGLIPEGFPTLIHGDGGVAKSLLALSFSLTLARGVERWLGRELGECCPVLYLDFELDADEQRRRVDRLAHGDALEGVPDGLRYMSAVGFPPREAFAAALKECKEHAIRLLVLDSLGIALQGDAEAARDVIGFFQRTIEPLRAAGVTVIMVDHQSRLQAGERYQNKAAFGSVYKSNLARSVIQAEATERGEGTLTVRLRHKKHNFGELVTPFEVKLTFGEEMVTLEAVELASYQLADEGTLNAKERIRLALQGGPAFPAGLAEATGLALKTVKNRLGEMRRAGIVEPTGRVEDQAEEVSLVSLPLLRDGDRDTSSEEDDAQGDQGNHGLRDEPVDEEAPWYTHPLDCGCRNCKKYG